MAIQRRLYISRIWISDIWISYTYGTEFSKNIENSFGRYRTYHIIWMKIHHFDNESIYHVGFIRRKKTPEYDIGGRTCKFIVIWLIRWSFSLSRLFSSISIFRYVYDIHEPFISISICTLIHEFIWQTALDSHMYYQIQAYSRKMSVITALSAALQLCKVSQYRNHVQIESD